MISRFTRRGALRPRTVLALGVAASLGASVLLAQASNAADGTGVYGAFTVNTPPTTGAVTFTGTIFPNASITSTDASFSVARSATLTSRTPFGEYFGSSIGQTYLSVAIASGKPSGTLTITFDEPPVPGTWAMAFGDVDAENVVISGTRPDGTAVNAYDWVHDGFNYTASGTDIPTWDAPSSTIIGNGSDTDGAAIWMSPTEEVASITLQQVRTSGFPQYQLWIAADVITEAPVPTPTASAAVIPPAPPGKVVICHATSSTRNPYNELTVSESAVTRNHGHGSHTGGLYPTAGWGDIIPPFGSFPGLNWPAGAAILNNSCNVGTEDLTFREASAIEPTPTASPSVSVSASPSPSASPSASVSPSVSASPSLLATESPVASPSTSASPSVSASPSASASASPSGSPSMSASPSASESASPLGSASPSASVSPTPISSTPTPSPTTSPTPAPTITSNPGDPVAIEVTDLPEVPRGSVITDVEEPVNGTADIRNGDVIFTPKPGFIGDETITVTVRTPEGTDQETTVTVSVGKEQTVITKWSAPKKLVKGTNHFGPGTFITNANQVAKVSAKCSILQKWVSPNPDPVCTVTVGKEGTYINVKVYEPTVVEVMLTAPKKGNYKPMKQSYVYRVNP